MFPSPLFSFLHTRPDRPVIVDPDELRGSYARKRWTTFCAITIGYSFFYTTRLTISVAKKPMIDAGIVGPEELGVIGSAFYLVYAFGRLTNGFLCDRAHIGRFMGTGLLVSAGLNVLFGWTSAVAAFLVLWGLNGWFQSMGSAPSGANLAAWFGRAERGTRYSVWSLAHNFGEGLTFLVTAAVVAAWGWRWAFWGPGLVCLFVALLLFRTILDRPPTYGLPPIWEYRREAPEPRSLPDRVARHQLEMLKNPAIWVIGLASASVYVARYGINEWFILYLQEDRGYGLVRAGFVTSFFPIVGIAGTLAAGPVSDFCFGGRRVLVTFLYGVLLLAGLAAARLVPAGFVAADCAAVSLCGFAVGGLLVLLGGLIAIDVSPRRAAGAAMGVVGVFSYLGAAIQNTVTGSLIETGRHLVDGVAVYDFDRVFAFWFGAAALCPLLTIVLARVTR